MHDWIKILLKIKALVNLVFSKVFNALVKCGYKKVIYFITISFIIISLINYFTVDSKIIQALEVIRVEKIIPNAVVWNI